MALRRAKPTPPSFSSNVSASMASPLMMLNKLLDDARLVVICVDEVTENDDTDEAARATTEAATIDSFVMVYVVLYTVVMMFTQTHAIF